MRSLASSYRRLQQQNRSTSSTSGQQSIEQEAKEDFETQLQTLEADVDDLEASVEAVEESGDRWGIQIEEVRRRRAFLNQVKREVQVSGKHLYRFDRMLATGEAVAVADHYAIRVYATAAWARRRPRRGPHRIVQPHLQNPVSKILNLKTLSWEEHPNETEIDTLKMTKMRRMTK